MNPSVYCARCGHSDHGSDQDPVNGDFCWKVTADGLCGCESWSPVYADEDQEDDGYEPSPGSVEASFL